VLVTPAIGLLILTFCFSLFQASSIDLVRNHRELIYTLGFLLRLLSFLVAPALLFILLRRNNKHAGKLGHLILTFLLVLLAVQSAIFYTMVADDVDSPYCINEVRFHGVTGDVCSRPL